MPVSVENLSNLERLLKIQIAKEEIDAEIKKRLQDLASKVKLDGFRPGKVPFNVVEKRYADAVHHEVINELLDKSYFSALQEQKLSPTGMPHIEVKSGKRGESLEYTAKVEIYPEIQLSDFSKMQVEKLTTQVSDADIDETLTRLRKQFSSWKEAPRAAQIGDRVSIDFEGTMNGVPIPDKKASRKDFLFVLGDKMLIEDLEKAVVGAKAGDAFNAAVTFPVAYHDKDVAGKPADFAVKVNKVWEAELPALDDEFAKKMGLVEGGIVALREQIKTSMATHAEQISKKYFKEKLFDQLLAANHFELPAMMLVNAKKRIREDEEARLADYGKKVGADKIKNLPRMTDDELTKIAERNVKLHIIMRELLKVIQVSVNDKELAEKVLEYARNYDNPEEAMRWYMKNKEAINQTKAELIEEKALDELAMRVATLPKTVSYQEMLALG